MANGCIFIVGYMGAGKSTGGKRLAASMRLPFIDTDVVLSESIGTRCLGLLPRPWGRGVQKGRERRRCVGWPLKTSKG